MLSSWFDGLWKEINRYQSLFMIWWAHMEKSVTAHLPAFLIIGQIIKVLSIRESWSELARGAMELLSGRGGLSTEFHY